MTVGRKYHMTIWLLGENITLLYDCWEKITYYYMTVGRKYHITI